MKKLNFLWILLALPLLVACSSDDIMKSESGRNNIPEGEGLYMKVNFSPYNKGTRSYTDGNNSSNGGIEVGSDTENTVSKVLLVLATSSNKYIASAVADNLKGSADNTNYQATAKIEKTKIKDFYDLKEVKDYIAADQADGGTGNPKVNVYVYCNPTEKMIADFEALDLGNTAWTNWTYKLDVATTDDKLWSPTTGFIMTNESIAEREFPASYSTWSSFTTENNAFDLSGWNNRNQNTAVDNSSGRGSISVHRMAARFDFRDGSQMTTAGGNGIASEPFTYKILVADVTTGEGEEQTTSEQTLVKAQIQTMSLVNMMNEQYYLERVSTGTTENDWTTPYVPSSNENGYILLGAEKPWYNNAQGGGDLNGNWVVTPNASNRTGAALKGSNAFATYYKYPFFNTSGVVATRGAGWDIYNVAEVVTNNKDYDNTGDYHIWRYVTENTMLGGNDDQMNGNTTGIVFRAKLLPGAYLNTSSNYWDNFLYTTLNSPAAGGPVLYAFSNNLYCSWQQVQYAALKSAGYDNTKGDNQDLDKTGTFYKMVFGNGAPGEVKIIKEDGTEITYKETTDDGTLAAQDPTSPNALHADVIHDKDTGAVTTTGDAWIAFRNKVVANTFTIYEKANVSKPEEAPEWGYYCYYYYWNRHNDNGDPDTMGEMEFAVVRNNVYKLAVTSIKKLGHPRIPENDPDDPKPDTPDEKSDLYMTVSVQVLPWVVRINNIEF